MYMTIKLEGYKRFFQALNAEELTSPVNNNQLVLLSFQSETYFQHLEPVPGQNT